MIRMISHRGNLSGLIPARENSKPYILEALDAGFDCEVDVRYERTFEGEGWYLGHDFPQYPISFDFLNNDRIWAHCKDLASLEKMIELKPKCHYFAHDKDQWVLTSSGFIWTFPGMMLGPQSICVMPESADYTDEHLISCAGICSDYILDIKAKFL